MNRLWVPMLGCLFAFQALSWAPEAEARFHKTLEEVAGNPERSAECAKGDTKAVRKIVGQTIKHAKERFKLTGALVDDTDTKRAEKELYDFLNWKIGSPSAVCGQYITAGQKHFNKGYSDEAAAALLGMELPGAGRAEFKLPKKNSDELKARIKDCAKEIAAKAPADDATKDQPAGKGMEGFSERCKQQAQKLAQTLEDNYGIPPALTQRAVKQVAVAAANQVPRISFNMPKSWDVENNVVKELMAKRRDERAEAR